MIKEFFSELDRLWKPCSSEPIELKIIGSIALILQSDYYRGTKDSDVLELESFSPEISQQLQEIAGKKSKLALRHGFYIDLVTAAIPFLPQNPLFHPVEKISLKNFRLLLLDIVDVVVSKLKRFAPQDVEDIKGMVDLGLVDAMKLRQRFQLAIDRWLMDARAQDFHRFIKNLHSVERDLLLAPESSIELPRWLEE